MKYILKSLLILLLSANVFAADNDTRLGFYSIKDFSKGLSSHTSPFVVSENQCVEAENIRFNKNYGGFGKRSVMTSAYDFGSNPQKSLHRYYESDGTTGIISTYSTFVATADIDSANQVIKNGMTDGAKWQWLTFKDFAIGMNGTDAPLKYDGAKNDTANTDGHRTANNLATSLGAPFAELNTGTDLTAAKWYVYKIAYTVSGLEYYCNYYSNSVLTGATVHNIALTEIPLGPSGTTARYIYRSLGMASEAAAEATADNAMYLVSTIADNSTTTYADTVSDATAGGSATFATFVASATADISPPIGKYCEINKSRLWISGNGTNPSYVYYSDNLGGGNPDYFGASSIYKIRENDGDEVTFLKNLLGILTVGKTNTIQKIYTESSSTDNWRRISDPFSWVGCIAPYSIDNSSMGLIYLARNGIYKFNGQSSTLISDAVTDHIEDISQINIENVVGKFFNNTYYLAYTSVESGSTINDRVLLYDLTRDAYSLDIKYVDSMEAFDSGSDQGVLYLGSSKDDGIVYANEENVPTLAKRLKSELDLGTFDDARTIGEENSPEIELAWDCTIDGWLTELQTKEAKISDIDDIETYITTATIDRPDTDGSWTSPIYRIDAAALIDLKWNERLNGAGDITWKIRLASTSGGIAGASWSSEFTDPSGSDISGVTANTYIQLMASLSTGDIDITPNLFTNNGYLFKLTYSRSSSTKESSFLSFWKSGWTELGSPGYGKDIERISIHYRGTEGELTFGYRNEGAYLNSTGAIDETITIDKSISPSSSETDYYVGDDTNKIYRFIPETGTSISGQYFQFEVYENSLYDFDIDKIEIVYSFDSSEDL